MSDISGVVTTEAPAVITNDSVSMPDDDAALGATFDKLVRDNGADREDGKFVSPDPDKRAEAEVSRETDESEVVADAEEGAEAVVPPPASVPLPANWRGQEALWDKIPAELRTDIAAHEAKLASTLTDQGRQLKPFQDVVARHSDIFESGKTDHEGKPVTPAYALNYFLGIQRELDHDAPNTLLKVAKNLGALDDMIAILNGQQPSKSSAPQPRAGLDPAQVEALVEQAFSRKTAEQTVTEQVARFAEGKPHYAAIEADLPDFIPLATQRLGEGASANDVLEKAYKLACIDKGLSLEPAAPKVAAVPEPDKTAAARKAASVNVTSTESGKTRALTEDEELGLAFDTAKKRA